MSDKLDAYTLDVGPAGRGRLDLQQDIIGADSRDHVRRTGLSMGMSVVDVGCGNGNMTLWLSEQVGPSGRVISVDISQQQIDRAREKACERGLSNIEFVRTDVVDVELEPSMYDFVYMRCILMHLEQPGGLLKKAAGWLKQGGRLASQEPVTSSAHSLPRRALFEELNDVLVRMAACKGIDFDIGDRMPGLLEESGFSRITSYSTQPTVDMGMMKRLLSVGIRECEPAAVELGVATPDSIDAWAREISDAGKRSGKYVLPRQVHVTGYKS